MKPIVIHLNTHKETNKVVDWILKKQFQSNFESFGKDSAGRAASTVEFAEFIKNSPELNAISTSTQIPVSTLSSDQFITTLFVKHPLDRLFGIYEVYRRGAAGTSAFSSIKSFVEIELDNHENQFLDAQFNFIQSIEYPEPENALPESVAQSIYSIQTLHLCGVMHRFEESIAVLEYELSKHFEHVDLSFYPTRTTTNKFNSVSDRLNLLHDEIGSGLFDQLIERNQRDLELIEHAEVALLTKLHAIPNWESKLIGLKNRGQSLR